MLCLIAVVVVYAHAYYAYRTYNTSCNFLLDTFLVISLVIVVVCRFIVICIYFHLIFNNHDITFLAIRMAVAFGKINTFNPSQEDWPLYVKQLGHVFGLQRKQKSEQFSFQ